MKIDEFRLTLNVCTFYLSLCLQNTAKSLPKDCTATEEPSKVGFVLLMLKPFNGIILN